MGPIWMLRASADARRVPVIVSKLEAAGFWVTRISLDRLRKESLLDWLQDAQEIWADPGGNMNQVRSDVGKISKSKGVSYGM